MYLSFQWEEGSPFLETGRHDETESASQHKLPMNSLISRGCDDKEQNRETSC